MSQLKQSSLFKQIISNPKLLFIYCIIVNMVPSIYFIFSQPLNSIGKIVLISFALGLYALLYSIAKNTGRLAIFLFPLFFLHAFQIVLFYLYGQDVIASDMFLNVATTNPNEAGELLGALLPAIVTVVLLYVPPTILAIRQWKQKRLLVASFRKTARIFGAAFLAISFIGSFFSYDTNTERFTYYEDVYPVNALYNLGYAIHKANKIGDYPQTSKDFSFEATRATNLADRQIIILVIGETSRADSWQLFGYKRPTNPLLSQENNLITFPDAITQSNATHKSVPIIMSSVGAKNFKAIYTRKGIFEAFKEAGFTTICLSNQAENHSFIEYFYKESDVYKNIRKTAKQKGKISYDAALVPLLKEEINQHQGDLFIILHSYGSHFNYKDRYPADFGEFKPDNVTNVSADQKQLLINAYDNSIRYTDYFLDSVISTLKQQDAASFLMYSADHGEDLFDDSRGKFLHASPTPTYYQLHIPMLTWFSNTYKADFPDSYLNALENRRKPVATNAVFHTLLDAAHISSPYLNKNLSLLSDQFKIQTRLYLNDHDKAVPFDKMNLKPEDFKLLNKNKIRY